MGKKVIVVDDSRTARVQVRSALAEAGYEVIDAVDGHDGLAKLTEHPDAAAVVCDINMPRMGGLEMIAEMRSKNVKVPVVVLTTEALPQLRQVGQQCGAKCWIVKPFQPAMLVRAVARLTGATESSATLPAAVSKPREP